MLITVKVSVFIRLFSLFWIHTPSPHETLDRVIITDYWVLNEANLGKAHMAKEIKQLVNQATVSGITHSGKGSLHGAGLPSAARSSGTSSPGQQAACMKELFLAPQISSCHSIQIMFSELFKSTKESVWKWTASTLWKAKFHMPLKFCKYSYLTISNSEKAIPFPLCVFWISLHVTVPMILFQIASYYFLP